MGILDVRTAGDPRQARLSSFIRDEVGPGAALASLGAVHAGLTAPAFREGMAVAGDKLFVHADDVPDLTAALLARVVENLTTATSARDDLLTAVFASYAVMAIHPFANGNGRTAIDFAQYLLMVRWGRDTSPLAPPADLHRIVARIYAALDPATEATAAGLLDERLRLMRTIVEADLEHLRRHDAFNCAADVFAACASDSP